MFDKEVRWRKKGSQGPTRGYARGRPEAGHHAYTTKKERRTLRRGEVQSGRDQAIPSGDRRGNGGRVGKGGEGVLVCKESRLVWEEILENLKERGREVPKGNNVEEQKISVKDYRRKST